MQTLTIDSWDDATQMAACRFEHNRRFQDFLKMGVRPSEYRRWDGKVWLVHFTKLPIVVGYARRYFHHVDYKELPEWVQIVIAKGTENAPRSPVGARPQSSYDVLYLLPTAPWVVVKAAYKALALIHHPDHGGDGETFREITEAYKKLEAKLSKSNES